MKKILLALALVLLLAIPVRAADHTIYVDGTNNAASWQFLTLQAAVTYMAANYPDLTADNGSGGAGVLNIEISITGAETTIAINGFTTSAAAYVNIYTTAGARHAGVWSDSKYRIALANVSGFILQDNYVRFTGIQVKLTSDNPSTYYAFTVSIPAGGSDIYITDSIFQGDLASNTSAGASRGLDLSDADATVTVTNTILYGFINGNATPAGEGLYVGGSTVTAANITSANSVIGIRRGSGTLVAKNCISYNNTTDYAGTFDAASTHNLSKDATVPALGTSYASKTLTFVNAASDFHLVVGDTDAIDKGTDLTVATDIDGAARTSGSWDLGADEYGDLAPPTTTFPSFFISGFPL